MRRALTDLGLGMQLALASRTGRLRGALIAGGVALGVVVLALAASVPHAYSAHKARERAATPVFQTRGRLRLQQGSTVFRGVTIGESAVQVMGARADGAVPLPPGVSRLPGPGEMVVSPEVRRLLRGPDGSELRRRLAARVVGTVGDAGLSEPNDAVIYRGSSSLGAIGAPAVRRFGATDQSLPTPVIITLLVIMIVVALLLPVGVFVATAARFGAEERDRRLAAMRLVGADRAATARVAAAEALLGAVAGLVLGAVGFLAVRAPLAHAGLAGIDVFTADVRPSPELAALVAVLVPLSAVAATLVSIRRAAVEPLGVSRRGDGVRRRLGWRLAAPVLGFVLLAPLLGSSSRLSGVSGQAEAAGGVVLVLVGVSALLPWGVEALVRRAPDGPLPWLLAIRRLRSEEGTTGRIVGAIGLAVAGAIALSIVFGAAQSRVGARVSGLQARTVVVEQVTAPTRRGAVRDLAALRRTDGVLRASGVTDHQARVTYLDATVVLRSGTARAIARIRDRAAELDPLAQVVTATPGSEAHVLSDLRRALFAGAVVVLVMIGASLLVAAGEGLRERRRALAVLAAFGARRGTIAWSMVWQVAIPVAGGLLLAVGLGIGLGAMLSAIVSLAPRFDWGAIGLMLAAGAAVIAAVTALTLPTLGRMMRPEALRAE